MNSSARRAATLGLAASALVAFGGCEASVSTSKTLNTGEAEEQIATSLTEQLGGKVTVSCPEDVKVEKDATFNCEATSPDGEKATVEVIQKDDEGNIRFGIKE